MEDLPGIARRVVEELTERRLFITTVESCTGGGIANCITNIPGASKVMHGAWVTYSCEEKVALGVPPERATPETVYSLETAVAMATAGIEKAFKAQVGVGVTGRIEEEHRGVCIAVVLGEKTLTQKIDLPAQLDRPAAKAVIIEAALRMVLEIL
jgi:PncC family amidohydrolase